MAQAAAVLITPTERLQPRLGQPHDGQYLGRAQFHRQVQDEDPIVASRYRLLEHIQADPKQPGADRADHRRRCAYGQAAPLANQSAGTAKATEPDEHMQEDPVHPPQIVPMLPGRCRMRAGPTRQVFPFVHRFIRVRVTRPRAGRKSSLKRCPLRLLRPLFPLRSAPFEIPHSCFQGPDLLLFVGRVGAPL